MLWRPERVAPLMANIASVTPDPYRALFIADPDDESEIEALVAAGADWIAPGPRPYAAKINAGYAATKEPFVFQAADDVVFHPGWLEAALAMVDDTAGVIGTNDGDLGNPRVAKGQHSVHSLIVRDYIETDGGTIDGPGTVLHEGYRHAFCDDELVGTARARGAYRHAHDSIVEHMHPYFAKADTDATYDLGQESMVRDRRRYQQRRRKWEMSRSSRRRSPSGDDSSSEPVRVSPTRIIYPPPT